MAGEGPNNGEAPPPPRPPPPYPCVPPQMQAVPPLPSHPSCRSCPGFSYRHFRQRPERSCSGGRGQPPEGRGRGFVRWRGRWEREQRAKEQGAEEAVATAREWGPRYIPDVMMEGHLPPTDTEGHTPTSGSREEEASPGSNVWRRRWRGHNDSTSPPKRPRQEDGRGCER